MFRSFTGNTVMQAFLKRSKSFFIRQYNRFRSQSLFRKIFLIAGGLAALIGVLVLTFVMLVWAGFFGKLPDKKELAEVENPAATEVYSADSVLLGRYFIQERSTIRYEDLPKHVEDALLATEDVRFYKHRGIDMISLARVLVKSLLLQKESSGGGSTITQQLAKNLYPRKSYRYLSLPINKTREMIIAWRLESVYDKKSILTLYVNTIPFADNTYGIDAAAQRFFSVRTNKLNVEQGAVLVGMLKATHLYNPRLFPERAKGRRDVVFAQMVKYEMLDADKAGKLTEAPLQLKYKLITRHKGLAPYFRSHIRKELLEWARENKKPNGEPYDIYTDGLKVYTTLDSRMQKYAEDAVKSQMTSLQKKFNQHWGSREPWYNQPQVVRDGVRRSVRYRKLKEQGLPENEIQKVMERKVPMTIFTWQGPKEVKMSPLDSVKHYLKFLNAGFIAMEPQTGAVRAWVGGIDHSYFEYDHIKTSTKRQVGSTFKPIVYAAAIEKGIKPCDFISAEKTTYTNIEDMDVWSPSNNDGNYEFKYSMEGALAYSVNTVSVKVLEKAGIPNTISLARKMGITSTVPDVPSIALGVADISMTEMVAAYASFVNNGKAVTPYFITSITTNKGKPLYSAKPERQKQALSPRTAEMMVHMLKRTVNEGTAGKLRWEYGVYNDLGGKTGTTQSNADGWFISVSPSLVVGSWVGADDPRVRFRATSLGQGSSTALPITAKFYQAMNKDKNFKSLTQAKFPALSRSAQSALGCPLYKSDMNFWESIFGVPEERKEIRRDFGDDPKKKKNLLRKLFKKKDLSAALEENVD